jgi:hypothetical protein
MTKNEFQRRQRLTSTLENLGFSESEVEQLRRISNTLQKWYERECNGDIERDDETGKPYSGESSRGRKWFVPDLENGAEKRLQKIMSTHPGLSYYLQTDPRGACLYILRPDDVPAGKNPAAYYSRGICVY